MSTHTYKKIITTFVCGFLCLIFFVTPISHVGGIKKAEAQGLPVMDIGQTLINTLAQLSGAALEQKELVLDGLFSDIATQALQQMTNDTLEWINSGLDGDPAFVTDLSDYLQEIADDVAAEYIYGEEVSSLCTPFKLDVQLSLVKSHTQENGHSGMKEQAACSLDGYTNDSEAFLSGDFYAGGWGAWFQVVLHPENTALGAKLALDRGQEAAKNEAKAEAAADVAAGGGFPSQRVCTTVGTGEFAKEKCSITTPGSIIRDDLSFKLQIPARKLIEADEINEAIGALFGNLANQAITGVNGLLGLGGNSAFSNNSFGVSGNLSYLDAVSEETANTKPIQMGGNRVQQALTTETRVLELELAIIEEIDAVKKTFDEAHEPYENDSCWNLEMPTELEDTVANLLVHVPETVTAVIELQELAERYETSNSSSAQLNILKELSAMQAAGQLSGQPAVIKYDFFLNSDLKEIIDAFEKDIEKVENSCD